GVAVRVPPSRPGRPAVVLDLWRCGAGAVGRRVRRHRTRGRGARFRLRRGREGRRRLQRRGGGRGWGGGGGGGRGGRMRGRRVRRMTTTTRLQTGLSGVGIGWRPEIAGVLADLPGLGFTEVVAENLARADGAVAVPSTLAAVRARGVPVIAHGIGLSL